ncbi:UBX domain-containing protein 11-like [Pogonomyrmex barbatus]|uniref:UBX domain-containing protein 11-like n=1 Tax=Pogonomyrmex barbatus TaxID=144034 RepID=A0A6I9W9G7_9HYME|nr:UBX domain-containing protein 11-like [Pogonomyrmex barbatus]
MLTKQLHLAESQMRKMQSVLTKAEEGLKTKDQEIGRLKRKIKEWETKYKNQELLRKKEQRSQANNSEYFYQRCLTLEHKISEMEKFLADYGLIWVGDPKNATNADGGNNNYIDICYKQLVANIDQLNLAAGKGEVHIHHNEKGGGATFKVIF